MTDSTDRPGSGWFAGVSPGSLEASIDAISTGSADTPQDWPTVAIDSGFAGTREAYYDHLHEATVAAAETAVREREQAKDRQLVHAVRAMDDSRRMANELAERVAEWGGDQLDSSGTGVEYAREVATRDPGETTERRLVALAQRCVDLADEADALRGSIERAAPEVAPNLAAMAGPVLAARLIDLAGGLESLAKMPSGTVQVLGAEDALFAHLRGDGPSPKHGVIYTHEYVRTIAPEHRGSAARAVAGKFTIAARVDHYSGERKSDLAAELDERIEAIRARNAESESGDAGNPGAPADEGDAGPAADEGGDEQ